MKILVLNISTKDKKSCHIGNRFIFFLKRNDFGRSYCKRKGNDGDYCTRSFRCLGGYCENWKCRSSKLTAIDAKDGPCENHSDCYNDQYCKGRRCANRKVTGWCTRSSSCLSNFCHVFRCLEPKS